MRRHHFAPKGETRAAAQARLAMLLATCTDAALAELTPAKLVATHRGLALHEAEQRLSAERQRRAGRATMGASRPRTADAAKGRWRGILAELGVGQSFLTGRHGPCPLCGGRDRFRFDDKEGRGTYFCSGCGPGTGLDLLQKLQGWDFKTAAAEVDRIVGNVPFVAPKPALDETKRAELLNQLWRSGRPVTPDDLAGRYLASRGLALPTAPVLRFTPSARAPGGGEHPAMVAMIAGIDGRPASLHRTFLGPRGKADIAEPRATMPGPIAEGAAIRLHPIAEHLGIAEGIETALAAWVLFGVPTWSAMNATVLAKWRPPEGVRRVTVFGDNDPKFGGAAAAYALAHRLAARFGLEVEVKIPSEPGADWADVLAAGERAA
ncbi:MAG: hypothetical protein A4S16_03510 [Proteobacteria bacterium SG_bin6]|nr:MAG: hypothetical protein A4S16_03510 [Proteobacteria bacterium SG_bin6]